MVLRIVFGTLGNLGPTRSLVPDVLALPAYALLAIAVAGLAGVRLRNRDDIDAILDAVVAALAVLMMAWVFLVTPALSTQSISFPVQVTLAAYPVADAFVLAMGARLAFTRGRRTPVAMWLYLAGLLCMLVGDVIYSLVDIGSG